MKRLALCASALLGIVVAQGPPPPAFFPSADELSAIRTKKDALAAALQPIKASDDLRVDVEIYMKAADWILRHPAEFYTRAYYDNTLAVLDRGLTRARDLAMEQ